MNDIRPFVPRGLPLLVLELVAKLDGAAWAGGMLPAIEKKRGKTTSPQMTIAIHRLRDFGLIRIAGEAPGIRGPRRKLWEITEKGKASLQEAMNLYDGFTRKPDMHDKADAA